MYEQIIYFGAPGTGKSSLIKEKLRKVSKDKIFRVTIHPEYTYSDFVGQLLPEALPLGGVSFTFKEGPFTRALIEAYADLNKDVYLVLEELSRGNVAAIFGDIFQLLDRDEHFVSRYPVNNKNVAEKIVTLTSDNIQLPSNFNILCTVNLNDQNVFPMDTAFKRRFEWEYISTKPAVDFKTGIRNSKLNNPKLSIAINGNRSDDIETTWQSFYTALNFFITNKEKGLGKGEDKQVGQFFIDFRNKLTEQSHSTIQSLSEDAKNDIDKLIKNKLLIYLWQDVHASSLLRGKTSLFDKSISSYDELYHKYGLEKVFSDNFINEFLIPNKIIYTY